MPPDYDTSQAELEDLLPLKIQSRARRKRRRLWRWVTIVLVVYFVVSVSISIPLLIERRRRNSVPNPTYYPTNGPSSPKAVQLFDDLYIPGLGGDAVKCNSWNYTGSKLTPSTLSLKYSMPSNETIYLQTNFSQPSDATSSSVTGNLLVSVADLAWDDEATVSVTMRRTDEGSQNGANVCLMRAMGGWGLSIQVPAQTQNDYLFNVELVLPRPNGTAQLSNLATSLPAFNQSFGSLDTYAGLDTFVAIGSTGFIDVQSVNARSIWVQTSGAHITGSFTASENLVLETILSPVLANISLSHSGLDSDPPTYLSVETGRSDINASVTLYTPASSAGEYNSSVFNAKLKTFSGTLESNFFHDESAQPSALFVNAENTQGLSQVFVDPKFQGTYDVQSNLAPAIVDKSDEDPSTEKDLQRQYTDDLVTPNMALGWVGWGSRDHSTVQQTQGHIKVVSSLSPAVLQLTAQPDPSRIQSILSRIAKTVGAKR